MLEFIHENLWIAKKPMDILGLDFGTVMTIVRMSNGNLFVHSPIEPGEELVRQINSIGPVEVVVSPNNFHHHYILDFLEYTPDCDYFYAPGLEKKLKNIPDSLNCRRKLSPFGSTPWDKDIEHLHISGMPFLDEYVFYHRDSKTLIASDLLIDIENCDHKFSRLLYSVLGVKGNGPGQSRLFKSCIRDKEEYNSAIERLGEWDINKMIVNQGGVINIDQQDLVPRLIAV